MVKDAKPGVPFVSAAELRERSRRSQQRAGLGSSHSARARGGDGDGGWANFLVGYAPGAPPQTLKPGQAKLVKAGSASVLQMHYTANGKPGTDSSRIGMVFSKELPTQRVLTLAAANPRFAIPPGDPNYQVDSTDHASAGSHELTHCCRTCICAARISSSARSTRPAKRKCCCAFRSTISTGSSGTCSTAEGAACRHQDRVHRAFRQLAE